MVTTFVRGSVIVTVQGNTVRFDLDTGGEVGTFTFGRVIAGTRDPIAKAIADAIDALSKAED